MGVMLQIVGVIFPVMIMALVPIRQYIMPYIFSRHTLHELDAAEYEEAPAITDEAAAIEAADNVELVATLDTTWDHLKLLYIALPNGIVVCFCHSATTRCACIVCIQRTRSACCTCRHRCRQQACLGCLPCRAQATHQH